MLSSFLKLLLREVSLFARRRRNSLIALAAERRAAMRLDRLADRLAGMGYKIDMLSKRLDEGLDEPLDADASLRESLKGLKEDIRTVRSQLASLSGPGSSPRLQRAFNRLSAIAEKTYAAADKLQWEIDALEPLNGPQQAPSNQRSSA
jgi:methyl-accepting chemotaxis protein